MKKLTSLIMIAILLTSMIQLRVDAEVTSKEYANILSEVGIFIGSDKGLELDREPTRLEGLILTLRMLGLEEEAQNYNKKVVDFDDVPAWGDPYVQYAYNMNLTKGISEAHFGSFDTMDRKSYLTFMLRLLGYNDDKNDFTWSNAIEKAVEVGIIKKSVMNSKKFLRSDLAEVSYNTLNTNLKGQNKQLVKSLIEKNKIDQKLYEKIKIKVKDQNLDNPVVAPIIIEEPMIPQAPVGLKDSIKVDSFGAIGNGIADDTSAIQKAINQASGTKKTLVFSENKTYKITKTLLMKSNLHIRGYGSTLYMPSQSGLVNMMLTDYGKYVENVTVEGLTFLSENDRSGVNYAAGSLTSNVTGLHFTGITNLKVKDVNMYDMNVGIKFGASSTNQINEHIMVENTHIYRSLTPLLMNTTNDFTMKKGTLDASAGSSRYLHSVYIDKNTSNITFDQVLFENSPGAGVHLYNGYANTNKSTNIKIMNSRVEDSRVGILIFSGANNVTVTNTEIARVDLGFSIDNAMKLDIDNIRIFEQTARTDVPKGALRIRNMHQSTIKNVTIDGNNIEGIITNVDHNIVVY